MRWRRLFLLLLVGGCAPGVRTPDPKAPTSAPKVTSVDDKPRPPDDLDARLVQHYPLRGLVLQESGVARVPFTVAPTGTVTTGEALSATRPEYAAACRRMLEGTVWTPARKAGTPTSFTSTFSCAFQHEGASGARRVETRSVAVPPVAPDYGTRWWDRYSDSFMHEDAIAILRVTVDVDGRPHVRSAVDGSDDEVASACTSLLEQGPAWMPAKDSAGAPVAYDLHYRCVLDVEGSSPAVELVPQGIGSSGALGPEQIAAVVADHYTDVVACLLLTPRQAQKALGRHRLAFEIRPDGHVGRVEWVEQTTSNDARDLCLTSTLRRLRFPTAPTRSIADLVLEVALQSP